KHLNQLSLFFVARKTVQFRDFGKARMELPSGYRDGCMDMECAFFQRFIIPPHDCIGAVCPPVDFAARQREVKFRTAEADNEPRLFEPQQKSEDAPAGINRVAYRLRSDSNSRRCAQFLQTVEPGLTPGKKNIRIAALRRAEKNQFVEIVPCPGRAEERAGD